jgi:hypothetical protein
VTYERKSILVVVKTYPNPSRSYGETVCCAGVDLETGRWVRIYPITFRRLAEQFAKYQTIECLVSRPRSGDSRPESLRADQDSIRLVGSPIPAGARGWTRRMAMLPEPMLSLEEVRAAQAANGTSLALVRPKAIHGLVIEKAAPWSANQKAHLRQQHLDLGQAASNQLRELEQIPFTFSYRFTCDDERCVNPHKLQIIDWEIGESYRRWSKRYGDDWEEVIRQTYERDLAERDLHLVVGNIAKHPQAFVIIGLVRPPRPKVDGRYVQQSLDLMGKQRPMTGPGVGLETEQANALGLNEGHEALEFFPDEG